MAGKSNCERTRDALRGYVLGTLPERERPSVAAHLDGCAACREALEAERAHLAVLDVLPKDEAPPGLAERTIAHIQTEGQDTQPARPWIALAVTAVSVILVAGTILPIFARARESARRASTQGNMKQLGLVFKMYANESPGSAWPQLAPATQAWVPELARLRGKFITDPQCLVSEEHPEMKQLKRELEALWGRPAQDTASAERLMGESFGYLGYTVENEDEFERVRRARETQQLPVNGGALSSPSDTTPIPPLREGVERFLITDINNPAGSSKAQSTIPVLVETATWKYKKSVARYKGANVLYMDGHVGFVKYGTFPVVPSVLDTLSGIETELPE